MSKTSGVQRLIENIRIPDIYPNQRWAQMLVKLPILTWRLGLGPITGKCVMIITHTDPKTGIPRRTVVEYHSMNGIKYVPCAFGEKSHLYRNILADPHVVIQTSDGTERMSGVRVTDPDELADIIAVMLRRDPPITRWYLSSLGISEIREDIKANKDRMIFLRFDPTNNPTPPALEVDLAWIWPILLIAALLRKKRRK
jgi:deazaflavin-dependent oxidoreductase (nitroreductase family)